MVTLTTGYEVNKDGFSKGSEQQYSRMGSTFLEAQKINIDELREECEDMTGDGDFGDAAQYFYFDVPQEEESRAMRAATQANKLEKNIVHNTFVGTSWTQPPWWQRKFHILTSGYIGLPQGQRDFMELDQTRIEGKKMSEALKHAAKFQGHRRQEVRLRFRSRITFLILIGMAVIPIGRLLSESAWDASACDGPLSPMSGCEVRPHSQMGFVMGFIMIGFVVVLYWRNNWDRPVFESECRYLFCDLPFFCVACVVLFVGYYQRAMVFQEYKAQVFGVASNMTAIMIPSVATAVSAASNCRQFVSYTELTTYATRFGAYELILFMSSALAISMSVILLIQLRSLRCYETFQMYDAIKRSTWYAEARRVLEKSDGEVVKHLDARTKSVPDFVLWSAAVHSDFDRVAWSGVFITFALAALSPLEYAILEPCARLGFDVKVKFLMRWDLPVQDGEEYLYVVLVAIAVIAAVTVFHMFLSYFRSGTWAKDYSARFLWFLFFAFSLLGAVSHTVGNHNNVFKHYVTIDGTQYSWLSVIRLVVFCAYLIRLIAALAMLYDMEITKRYGTFRLSETYVDARCCFLCCATPGCESFIRRMERLRLYVVRSLRFMWWCSCDEGAPPDLGKLRYVDMKASRSAKVGLFVDAIGKVVGIEQKIKLAEKFQKNNVEFDEWREKQEKDEKEPKRCVTSLQQELTMIERGDPLCKIWLLIAGRHVPWDIDITINKISGMDLGFTINERNLMIPSMDIQQPADLMRYIVPPSNYKSSVQLHNERAEIEDYNGNPRLSPKIIIGGKFPDTVVAINDVKTGDSMKLIDTRNLEATLKLKIRHQATRPNHDPHQQPPAMRRRGGEQHFHFGEQVAWGDTGNRATWCRIERIEGSSIHVRMLSDYSYHKDVPATKLNRIDSIEEMNHGVYYCRNRKNVTYYVSKNPIVWDAVNNHKTCTEDCCEKKDEPEHWFYANKKEYERSQFSRNCKGECTCPQCTAYTEFLKKEGEANAPKEKYRVDLVASLWDLRIADGELWGATKKIAVEEVIPEGWRLATANDLGYVAGGCPSGGDCCLLIQYAVTRLLTLIYNMILSILCCCGYCCPEQYESALAPQVLPQEMIKKYDIAELATGYFSQEFVLLGSKVEPDQRLEHQTAYVRPRRWYDKPNCRILVRDNATVTCLRFSCGC